MLSLRAGVRRNRVDGAELDERRSRQKRARKRAPAQPLVLLLRRRLLRRAVYERRREYERRRQCLKLSFEGRAPSRPQG